ncbi:polymorphic toxin-type HINT domain-containing protein [Streptomyces sp. NPDC002054]|uniref:polymorphic toxin-type HINT domain-containing protein n=1 Tax=Streptomyces sp. NPDC002054 TaxID=3154663 RepID=UPI003319FACC
MAVSDTDRTSSSGKVTLEFDVTAWAKTAGANWADRARMVQLPACALTTPGADGCTTRTPVAAQRDAASGRLVAEIEIPARPGAFVRKSASSAPSAGEAFAAPTSPAQNVVLGVDPGPSGAAGDFSATPLLPSMSWQAGANAANFTYGYTVEVPSAIAGPAPSVGLSYDSSSLDGRTASTNAQASWIGDGWDWHPGSISRSYKTCKDVGIKDSGDECWGGDVLSLNLAGHAGEIVRDDNSCVYRLRGDDGSKIERLTGRNNGAWKGEAWKVTTGDGAQYYFGANRLPGGDGTDPEAKSVSRVPVYWPGGQDKCMGADSPATGSWNDLGWQWNLDYVVDPHQNLISYRYEQETNHYSRGGGQNNGNGTLAPYHRGSYPAWVGYGQRLPDQIAAKGAAKPAAQVWFRTGERCTPIDSAICKDPANQRTTANAAYWPDVPIDQECKSTGTCLNLSPTYFTTKKLNWIDTEVLEGTTYRRVDTFGLKHTFEDPQDGTSRSLWLNSIQRLGKNGQATLTVPAVTFQPKEIANRVDGTVTRPDGTEASAPRYNRPRIQSITTETGGQINVVYKAAECSRTANRMPASEDSNTMACMPVKWYLPGQSYPDPVNDWFNKVIVQSVTEQDKVGGQVAQVTEYAYDGGIAWHRNDSELPDPKTRTWDQFRGYASVTTRTGNASEGPRTKSTTHYLRGMDGDVLKSGKRSVSYTDADGKQQPDQDVLSGFAVRTQTFDGDTATLVAEEISAPWLGEVTATRAQSGGMPAITARALNTAKVTNRARLANNNWRTSERTSTYDDTLFSRPLRIDDRADTSRSDQRLCTTFDYATGPSGSLTQLASRTLVLSGTCGQTPTAANTVGDTRTYFDSLPLGQSGAAADQTGTEVLEKYDGAGKPVYRRNATSTYDAYGRVTSTTNNIRKDAAHPGGAVTKTEYKPATGSLPTEVVHTNPLGWKSYNTLDIGRALPLKSTDENGHIAEREYDALGRVIAVWQPGQERSKGSLPVRKFSYTMNGTNAPTTVLSQTLMNNDEYINSFTIYDGLGRVRQTQARTPSGAQGRIITDALFDSHGRQVKTSAPYYNDEGAPSGALFLPNGGVTPDSKIPAQTVQVFDGLGRSTASVFQSYGVEQWRSKTEYPGADEVRSIPPNGGFASAAISDGLGQRVALRQYKANTPTGAYDETTYGYNAQGKELWRKDSAGNEWTFTYDLLGRLTKSTDPDSGTSTTAYDDAKNLVSATDARGKNATTVSDLLGRPVATYEGTAVDPAKQVAGFTYDTKALGKPSTTTRYVGGATGAAYVSEVTGYDGGYRPLGTKTTIPAVENELAGTYETTNTYDKYGHLRMTALPAISKAGLTAETVAFGYNIGGSLISTDGKQGHVVTPYVVDLRYDPYGRVTRTTVGNTGKQIVSTVDYDAGTGRPVRTTLDKQTAARASVDVTDYTYNKAGSLTSIRTVEDGAQADQQCFTHDYLGRLTQSWTDTGTINTAPQPSVRGIGGCTNATGPSVDGTGKPSLGGPAPYWQQYEYDKTGNRTKLVRKDTAGNASKDVTVTQTFADGPNTPSTDPATGGGTGGPHALLKSTETGPSGTKVTSYTYDAAGNTASITSTPGTKNLTWNGQGKLDKITGTGESAGTNYLYDTGGNQLIRRDPGKTTLNLGTDQITLDTATKKVTNVRTYAAPGGLSITRTTTGGTSQLTYQGSDHHGTGGVQFDSANLAQTRRHSDPFGNARGTQPTPGTWAGDKGFVGGTKEESTGFTLLGAREYDPTTGRFISPDPIIDPGNPQQWNAYAYSSNGPINKSDPTGLREGCSDPEECKSVTNVHRARTTKKETAEESKTRGEVDAAQNELNSAKQRRDEIKREVINVVMDLIGYNDARDCFTKGDVMACINTALNSVPWGKVFKAIKVGIKAYKIYKQLNKAYDAIHAAERRSSRAMEAFTRAKRAGDEARAAEAQAAKSASAKAADDSASDAASTEAKASKSDADAEADAGSAESRGGGSDASAPPAKCNSFPAGVRVLMADGSTKEIEDVRDGDTVMATDPQTGETRPKKVTATITTPDDKEFTDLTLTDDANPRGPPSQLTSTRHHPHWNETRKQWVDAGDFTPGDQLIQPNGTTLTVSAVRTYPYAVTTHNLTVNDFHTYYVLAGAAPVLVHNCPAAADDSGPEIVRGRGRASQDPSELPDLVDPANGGYSTPRGTRSHSEPGTTRRASQAVGDEAQNRASTVSRAPTYAEKMADLADSSGGSGGIVEAAAAAGLVGWRAWQFLRGWLHGRRS